ncbi:MAG: response regulator [Verrucomicrobia bacterium]|nr:response regulator [Verrucomicrobiota bacterium]
MRVLIVDDEPLAREGLRQLLAREPDVVVVGECGDGETALTAVAEHRPDVLFLDVQMPGLSGFDVVAALPEATSPAIVFVTAHDRYAVRAFEECAADYLLKPVDEQRFARTLARLRTNLATPPPAPPFPVAAWSAPTAAFPERLMIGLGPGRSAFLRVADIVWIEAQDYCVEIHAAGGRRHLVRRSLEELETLLDPQRFARVHRSALVNIDQVQEIRPLGRVRAEARLTDGTRVPVSRERLRALEARWPRLI